MSIASAQKPRTASIETATSTVTSPRSDCATPLGLCIWLSPCRLLLVGAGMTPEPVHPIPTVRGAGGERRRLIAGVDQDRSDHDQQLGALLLRGARAEELSQHRDVTQ